MSFTGAINSVLLSNYANFQGRAVRSEYWYFVLFCLIVGFVIGLVGGLIGAIIGTKAIGMLIQVIFELAILIPSIAVGVRRLHDQDKSGWWLLLAFVPVVGGIILLVFFCMPGTRGANRFGGGGGYTTAGPMPMPVGFN